MLIAMPQIGMTMSKCGAAHDDHGSFFKGPAMEFIDMLPEIQAPMEILHHNITSINIALDGDKAEGGRPICWSAAAILIIMSGAMANGNFLYAPQAQIGPIITPRHKPPWTTP